MATIRSSIACNLDTNVLLASIPLFESEKVQAIEWSFDTLYQHEEVPSWFVELLQAFSQQDRLIGHGVFFSLFSGKWTNEQQEWLTRLKTLSGEYRFAHITEHVGFMTGADFHKGAPLSIPFTASTLSLGRDRLKRIQDAGNCPVGLENLAFAYSMEEVKRQGDFLNHLVESINGFLILDLHNLYCQIRNFAVEFQDLLALYPLDRVREIHISGGSWSSSQINPARKIRRDTHDASVPREVFALLEQSIDQCPNLKYVVLEQLGSGLHTEESRRLFQQDFCTMDQIVQSQNGNLVTTPGNSFLPLHPYLTDTLPLEDELLYHQQRTLSTILETSLDYQQARTLLAASSLANSAWGIEQWEPSMLETALAIAQKWRMGFD